MSAPRHLLPVLRRAAPTLPYAWVVVRALRHRLRGKDWRHLEVYSYREDRVVFLVDGKTGMTLAFASTLPRAKEALRMTLSQTTRPEFEALLKTAFKHVSPPPKPERIELINRLKL